MQADHPAASKAVEEFFPTDIQGLREAQLPAVVELSDGDTMDLNIAPVRKAIGDAVVHMLAYNAQSPARRCASLKGPR